MGKVCSTLADSRCHSRACAGCSAEDFGDFASVGTVACLEANHDGPHAPKQCVKSLPTPVRSFAANASAPSSGNTPRKLPATAEACDSREGRRRSLLVGINYYDTQDELHGCVNDVMRMIPVLNSLGFPTGDETQRILTDGPSADPRQRPTRANILHGIAWLVEGAQKGDALFFHYSGHGGRSCSSEPGQFRETLVPVDFESAGLLEDQEVTQELVEKLPEGCRLTCLIDSAKGAGAPLALPSMFLGDSSAVSAAKHGGAAVGRGIQRWTAGSKRRGEAVKVKAEVLVLTTKETVLPPWSTRPQVGEERICMKPFGHTAEGSANAPSGTLYVDPSRAAGGANWGSGGVLTSALLEVLSNPEKGDLSLLEVVEKINKDFVDRGYMQAPLLAASKALDLRQRFELDTWLC